MARLLFKAVNLVLDGSTSF